MNHPIAKSLLKVFVDPDAERIVQMEQDIVPIGRNNSLPNWLGDSFQATIDYPEDVPDSMFDVPAGALTYDFKESRKELAGLLKGHIGEAEVGGQKVVLKALLYDGIAAYTIWTGCPAEYNDSHGFKIDGVRESATTYNMTAKDGKPLMPMGGSFDPRCLTAAKCMRKPSAACPYCAMGRGTTKPISGTVALTLPVYQPDPSRPFKNQSGKVVGYHSRYVGDATFERVPVTLSSLIGMYEGEFGLHNNFW
jgi:hypothetical protein